ncbi:hypothetical protein [Rhizobium leguminosarum]
MTGTETQHSVSKLKAGNEAKAMSFVDAYSPEEAVLIAKKMFERECSGWGDEERAMKKLARQCGISAVSFKRLMKGQRKTFDVGLCNRIRVTYKNFCLSLISQLLHEVKVIEEVHGHAAVSDILADVEALEEKARAAFAEIPKAKQGR